LFTALSNNKHPIASARWSAVEANTQEDFFARREKERMHHDAERLLGNMERRAAEVDKLIIIDY